MKAIFSGEGDISTLEVWGPTATVNVIIDALGGIVKEDWLLVNLSAGAREIVDVRQCFNDVSVIYALGNNQGQCVMSLTFAIFVGRKNCTGSGPNSNTVALAKGFQQYASNRISKKPQRSSITIGSFSRFGWLTGIDIGNLDAEKGICYGTVHFIMELES